MEGRLAWRRWLALVAAGELGGFALPAMVGILARDLSSGAQLLVMPLAGLFEGALLGLAQAVAFRRSWAALRERDWVVATSLAAGLAWFLGMLPSTTHDTWSTWPTFWIAAAAAVLGAALLASIGTAQAWVMPPQTRGRMAWVGWTALGWCAGLTAFTVVAPPLWKPGQATWLLVLIGVAGGLAMATAMAAVTGVGAVRLVDRAGRDAPGVGFTPGLQPLSSMLGTAVYDASGGRVGHVRDLVADLALSPDHPPVTRVVVSARGGRRLVVPYSALMPRPEGGLALIRNPELTTGWVPTATELLLRRDVLDAPVILTEPPRRTRVNDVVLNIGPNLTSVVGVDLSPRAAALRLVRRTPTSAESALVLLSRAHLVSAHGHTAQLGAPSSPVLALPAHGLAEVLTRVPVAHAREIIHAADLRVREDAVRLLHPHVRARLTGNEGPPRRTRRLSGWRLHRPGTHRPNGAGR